MHFAFVCCFFFSIRTECQSNKELRNDERNKEKKNSMLKRCSLWKIDSHLSIKWLIRFVKPFREHLFPF